MVVRGRRYFAKRVTKGVLLSQGLQKPLEPLPAIPDHPSVNTPLDGDGTNITHDSARHLQFPTVLQGALDNIQRYPHCVLFTRVGGFYELYFNHAEEWHQALGLKRSYKETKLGPVAMAGFPFFQLDRYLKMLVGDMGKNVAISEEFTRENGPQGSGDVDLNNKNLFDRRVSRIVTPGTLIDEKFVETSQSNYLLSVYTMEESADDNIGLAWMDLSTGEFITQHVRHTSLISAVQRLQPKEIITSTTTVSFPPNCVISLIPRSSSVSAEWSNVIDSPKDAFTDVEAFAGSALLEYIASNLPGSNMTILPPIRRRETETMDIDGNALHSLEIRQSMRDQSIQGSLLHAIRRTITKSGSRLLAEWLVSPSTSIPVLEQRLDLVDLIMTHDTLKVDIERFLKTSGDSVRVLQRFGFGRGEVDDLLTISKAISATAGLLSILQQYEGTQSLSTRLHILQSLQKKINNSIDEAGLMRRNRENAESAAVMMEEVLSAINDPSKPTERRRKAIEREISFMMKSSASTALRQMHKSLADLEDEKRALELRLKETTSKPSLTLKTLPGVSHIVHIKGTDTRSEFDSEIGAKSIGATRSTRSYHLAEWSYLGTQIDRERLRIQQEETRTFQILRRDVLKQSKILRENARVLDELDVASCFASLATENDWVRPALTNTKETKVLDGRHPIVEFSLRSRGLQFTPNSAFLDENTSMYLVTGTNMGGKSTYLRQIAVIQILAQIGSYVPARCATIGIVDALFSRLGSSDNLFRNESTFMCEMKETATILAKATSKSLVLMDEVGRGTTSLDGTAIAYACMKALNERSCRTLFATHFHELANLLKNWKGVGMLYTDIVEHEDGSFEFSHEIKEGVCRDSHGLKIAQLAGLPRSVIGDAALLRKRLLATDTPYLNCSAEKQSQAGVQPR